MTLNQALAVVQVGWKTKTEQDLFNEAYEVIYKEVGGIRTQREIEQLRKRLDELQQNTVLPR